MSDTRIEFWQCDTHATADVHTGSIVALFQKDHDDELWEVYGLRIDGIVYREDDGRHEPERLPEGDLNRRLTDGLAALAEVQR